MILSDTEILYHLNRGNIKIEPFDERSLGSNSYDVHLSKHLAQYDITSHLTNQWFLDAKLENKVKHFEITDVGFVLLPGILYLGSTIEYTETHFHIPMCEGKSSGGRLGLSIHATAGKGDVGFCNHWTLELSVIHPVKIYPGMPIGQLIYHSIDGKVQNDYSTKSSSKYTERNHRPVESKMWKNSW